ncbi:MAG: hypothetical protein A4S17_11415 [Proteobacteria bacterium HN_bin10]|nr:MAG: hypothetical protein A4S17_11415 [Proteobacteria bacterium HN_bin10]
MSGPRLIQTDTFAKSMRERIIKPTEGQILISRLEHSDQEDDLTVPPNCEGLGRIRHFRRATSENWPSNSLPIDPAAAALGLARADMMLAQVFQNAACAWRCWYCYVPYNLLAGDATRGRWMTADALVDLYLREPDRPQILDLSGGSPDLTPEWTVWMMESLERAGAADTTYLWSDDNLSTDYLFTKLSDQQRRRLRAHKNYGRVCCFKGFDNASFQFNTGADGAGFDAQFEIFQRYLGLGIDLYGYVTLTGPELNTVDEAMPVFMDRLQQLDEAWPLRIVPLRIEPFAPNTLRQERRHWSNAQTDAVQNQAIALWNDLIERRFSASERAAPIYSIPLGARA